MDEITTREKQLLELLVNGDSNQEAAKKLGIALRTMELHRQKVMQKLGAQSAAQLGYLYAGWKRQSTNHVRVERGDGGGEGGSRRRV